MASSGKSSRQAKSGWAFQGRFSEHTPAVVDAVIAALCWRPVPTKSQLLASRIHKIIHVPAGLLLAVIPTVVTYSRLQQSNLAVAAGLYVLFAIPSILFVRAALKLVERRARRWKGDPPGFDELMLIHLTLDRIRELQAASQSNGEMSERDQDTWLRLRRRFGLDPAASLQAEIESEIGVPLPSKDFAAVDRSHLPEGTSGICEIGFGETIIHEIGPRD